MKKIDFKGFDEDGYKRQFYCNLSGTAGVELTFASKFFFEANSSFPPAKRKLKLTILNIFRSDK